MMALVAFFAVGLVISCGLPYPGAPRDRDVEQEAGADAVSPHPAS